MYVLITLACALSCFCLGEVVSGWDSFLGDDFTNYVWNPKRNVCETAPLGRVPWIIYVRNSDYGWNEHTHRANIALAVNAYRGSEEDMRKMELQLEVEITKALFRRNESEMHDDELALFIHALIATCKSPRNFHGTDLVANLQQRVENTIRNRGVVHPFLVLALCNGGVVDTGYLENIKVHTEHDHGRLDLDGRNTELKALALKAFACAADLDPSKNKFPIQMERAAECLTRRQNDMKDGSFGNVYTTSLAVQALTACKHPKCINTWNEAGAREFLLKESVRNVNIIKAYYIEMALNAGNVTYVRNVCGKIWPGPGTIPPEITHYVQYTIRKLSTPEHYFTLTISVKKDLNFFEIMKIASELSDKFSFNYTVNNEGVPMVHRVDSTPNDAEANLFWRICRQSAVDHDRHTSVITNYHDSPQRLIPVKNEHIFLWYRDTECPRQ